MSRPLRRVAWRCCCVEACGMAVLLTRLSPALCCGFASCMWRQLSWRTSVCAMRWVAMRCELTLGGSRISVLGVRRWRLFCGGAHLATTVWLTRLSCVTFQDAGAGRGHSMREVALLPGFCATAASRGAPGSAPFVGCLGVGGVRFGGADRLQKRHACRRPSAHCITPERPTSHQRDLGRVTDSGARLLRCPQGGSDRGEVAALCYFGGSYRVSFCNLPKCGGTPVGDFASTMRNGSASFCGPTTRASSLTRSGTSKRHASVWPNDAPQGWSFGFTPQRAKQLSSFLPLKSSSRRGK